MDSDRQWGWYRGIASWHALCGTPPPLTTPDYYHPSFASFRPGVVLLRFSLELIGHPRHGQIYIPSLPPKSFRKRLLFSFVVSEIVALFVYPAGGGNRLFPKEARSLRDGRWGLKESRGKRRRMDIADGSKILIHSRCRDADLRSSFGSKLCPCLPAVKCNTGGRGNAFE